MNSLLEPMAMFQQHSIHERLPLVEDLWDTIALAKEEPPFPAWWKSELDVREADFQLHSEDETSWEEIQSKHFRPHE